MGPVRQGGAKTRNGRDETGRSPKKVLAFPFSNAFAMTRAVKGKEGLYMSLYAMAFSLAHIFSAKTGMEVVDRFGFDANWYLMGFLSLVAVLLTVRLKKMLNT